MLNMQTIQLHSTPTSLTSTQHFIVSSRVPTVPPKYKVLDPPLHPPIGNIMQYHLSEDDKN